MKKQGIKFLTSKNVGVDIKTKDLIEGNDAVILACGSSVPRELDISGRCQNGIHFAMEFLEQNNRFVRNKNKYVNEVIEVKNKRVVVIGGGDTGADCVGTSIRRGAKSVMQIEILDKPPKDRNPKTPWPLWPDKLRTSTSHEEGCQREWAINTKSFVGNEKGDLIGINIVKVEWQKNNAGFDELIDTERFIECDIVFIAAGFLFPDKKGPINDLNLTLDERGNVKTQNYLTSHPNVYASDYHISTSSFY